MLYEYLPDYDSPLALKAFLDEKGMAMQKKFGQNFLINSHSRTRLVDALNIQNGTTVWEIGPGLGAMTKEILERGAVLTAFEIDRGFVQVLHDFFSTNPHFNLIEGDVLKNWMPEYERSGLPQRLFGNLPYNIASAMIADMISSGARFETVVVTVQKEVALRMNAKPGTADYSSFSLLCQWAYDIEPLFDLAGGSFWPRPNVDSRAVRMTKKDNWPGCSDPKLFMSLLRAIFASRRKTLKNNVTVFYSDAEKAVRLLDLAGIDPQLRAERLTIEDLLRLSDCAAAL